MIERTIARDEARRIYDQLGAGLDWAARFGRRPLQLAGLLTTAGSAVERRVVVQRGLPSEVLIGHSSASRALSSPP